MTESEKTTNEVIALLKGVETATLGHLLDEGFMSPAIQQLYECPPVCGPALTVSTLPDDGAALLQAIAAANPGDILVVERDGDDRHACWGAVLTAAAQGAGIAGVVIDGFVTDAGAIRAAGLPVWCKGRSPLTTKPGGRGGSVNTDIRCGGATVRAGDLVLADENGVCILDPQQAFRLANEALQMQASEPALISRLSGGEAIDQVFGTPKLGGKRDDVKSASTASFSGDGVIEVPVISDALRQLGAPVSALARIGGLLLTCGMPPLDIETGSVVEGDIETQTHAVLDALEHTLRHVGSSLDDVVKANVFLTDAASTPAFNAAYRRHFRTHFPVRTTVAVSPWKAAFNIEIECIAIDRPRSRR